MAGDTWYGSARWRTTTALTWRRAFVSALDVYTQLMALFTLADGCQPTGWRSVTTRLERLPSERDRQGRLCQWHLAFLGQAEVVAAQFARVESKANVADAVSRRDLSRARERWTRLDDYTDSSTAVLIMAASDAAAVRAVAPVS